jgi:SAM-dependent methyltransferase
MKAIWGMKKFVLWALVAFGCLMGCAPLEAQTPDEVEKSTANLPPDQRAYERFRFWFNSLPPEQQRDGKVDQRYHTYLKSRGLTDADADAQIKLVDQGGARAEVERWNQILTAEKPRFNTKPNAFLVEVVKGRKPGTALDVGMGQGRNSIWLAQQGWDVTGFDPAEKAVALARETAAKVGVNLKTEIKTTEGYDFGERRWDLILLSYVAGRGITEVIQRALKPGGVLVIEGFHRDATKSGPIGAGVVFDTGELPSLFPQLRVVRYEEPITEADFGQIRVRVVRYCGERPE